MSTLFMFPGQGSQKIGMGKELYDHYPNAKKVFEIVDEALNEKLSDLIFNGEMEKLTLTENVQPALMTVSMAALKALETEMGKTIDVLADFVVGHSLGEYSALCATGAITLEDTAKLLRARGQFMQNASPIGEGVIAVIIGLDMILIDDICRTSSTKTEMCQVANDNCPGQTVISGHTGAIERAIERAQKEGARRAMKLPVSAPVHSALMKPAQEKMAEFMKNIEIKVPSVPLISNYSANTEKDPETIRKHLLEQFTQPVRFTECISEAVNSGVTHAYEIGAGRVLCGLAGRIGRDMTCAAVNTPQDIENFIAS